MAEIIWSEPALQDLKALAEYIALDKPDAAKNLVRRVFEHVELLAEHSDLGPIIPELQPGRRYRQLVETLCRIFYRHEKSRRKVHILAVTRAKNCFKSGCSEKETSRASDPHDLTRAPSRCVINNVGRRLERTQVTFVLPATPFVPNPSRFGHIPFGSGGKELQSEHETTRNRIRK
jgi:plasmid stabilization system protein ParE